MVLIYEATIYIVSHIILITYLHLLWREMKKFNKNKEEMKRKWIKT